MVFPRKDTEMGFQSLCGLQSQKSTGAPAPPGQCEQLASVCSSAASWEVGGKKHLQGDRREDEGDIDGYHCSKRHLGGERNSGSFRKIKSTSRLFTDFLKILLP